MLARVLLICHAVTCGYIFRAASFDFYPAWNLTHEYMCAGTRHTTVVKFAAGQYSVDSDSNPVVTAQYILAPVYSVMESSFLTIHYSNRTIVSMEEACDYLILNVIADVIAAAIPSAEKNYPNWAIELTDVNAPTDHSDDGFWEDVKFTVMILVIILLALGVITFLGCVVFNVAGRETAAANTNGRGTGGSPNTNSAGTLNANGVTSTTANVTAQTVTGAVTEPVNVIVIDSDNTKADCGDIPVK